MNRLVIIGNGFDLAHGIKTSFKDFISDYLVEVFGRLSIYEFYKDELIDISINKQFNFQITELNSLQTFCDFIERGYIKKNSQKLTFFINCIEKAAKFNWVDLEIEYFEYLTRGRSKNEYDDTEVRRLNTVLESIKAKLQAYLLKQVNAIDANKPKIKGLASIFMENIKANDFVLNGFTDKAPENLYILNFNYTKTVGEYIPDLETKTPTFNHIHGELESKTNPMIFGFGDEYDKKYLEFEEHKNNELFKHIKSFAYTRTSNYHEFLRFVEADQFQVYILGHSCGLSDRTMLKHIFEHENCKSIKVFYHERPDGTNDFTEKMYDIARHFSDKGKMRQKIASFEKSSPFPQLEK